MDFTKIVKANLDSPWRELSNGGLGIFICSPFGVSGNWFFVCFYWGSNPAVGIQQTIPTDFYVQFLPRKPYTTNRLTGLCCRRPKICMCSWIERQLPIRWKFNLTTNQKGCDNSETIVGKLLARRIQICWVYFCVIHISPFFRNNFLNNVWTKVVPAKLDGLVKYSSAEVSDSSEVPQFFGKLIFWLVQEVKLICVCSIISCSRIPAIF